MVRLLRLLRGYVIFVISGSCPERFINICTYNGINVWGVKSREGEVYCCTLAANYRIIRKLSRRCSAKVRIKKKRGLPFIFNRNKNRVGLIIGAVCFLIIFKILSLFVWTVDIYGAQTISNYEARQVMESVGIYEGVYGKFESLKNIQTRAMIAFGNVSWLTVNINGSSGEVKISESVPKGEIVDKNTPCNIKAECDAQILRVDAYSGVSAVNSGDAVVKGNLLISGVVENEQGAVSLVHANGVVWAKTNRNELFTVSKNCGVISCAEMPETRYSCRLFNLIIPITGKSLSSNGNYFYFTNESKAEFNGAVASLSLITENIYSYENIAVSIDEQTARSQLDAEILLNELFNYNNKKITNRSIKSVIDDEYYIYEVSYECEEDIGVSHEILTDDNFSVDNRDNSEESESYGE